MEQTYTALGVSTKLGGMTLGASQGGLSTLGTVEGPFSGVTPQTKQLTNDWLKVTTLLPSQVMNLAHPELEVVMGNPKCALFTTMTNRLKRTWSGTDPDSIQAHGPELMTLLDVAKHVKPQILWLENGPQLYSRGRDFVKQIVEYLGPPWNRAHIGLYLIDAPWCGVPQFRPRTHLLISQRPIRISHTARVPMPLFNTWSFVNREPYPFTPSPYYGSGQTRDLAMEMFDDPVAFAKEWRVRMKAGTLRGFQSLQPTVVDENSYQGGVVLPRIHIWKEHQAFWALHEFAALQSYDVGSYDLGTVSTGKLKAISRSVPPAVAKWVTENLVLPTLRGDPLIAPNWYHFSSESLFFSRDKLDSVSKPAMAPNS